MSENTLFKPNCIRTFTGQYVNFIDPDPDTIVIEDIAHALSNMCRWGGHTPRFYSVAQHSILCSKHVDKHYRLAALMHDASEAYLMDIPRPIKKLLANYNEIENKLMEVIAKKFKFEWPMPEPVRISDDYMLYHEWNFLIENNMDDFACFSPEVAKVNFLKEFRQIFGPEPRYS